MIENEYIDDCYEAVKQIMVGEVGLEVAEEIAQAIGDLDVFSKITPFLKELCEMTAFAVTARLLQRFEGIESSQRFLTDLQLQMIEHAEDCEVCRGEAEAH